MGGLSIGFAAEGFDVHGYDSDRHAVATYQANVGPATMLDLVTGTPRGAVDCIVGGPPCRPWSPINLQRRGVAHRDYVLARAFDRIVLEQAPSVFVLENVPLLRFDTTFGALVEALEVEYSVHSDVLSYAEWGAASRRRRLFVIGVRKKLSVDANRVFEALNESRTTAQTVRSAIWRYRTAAEGQVPDHEWAHVRTIARYADKYESGKFGWYRLTWDDPAPSFGHVAKTYTLHPDGADGQGPRVLSVREVMAILGFDDSYVFPDSVPRTAKYRMGADAVSPAFGRALARAIKQVLGWP